MKPNKHSITDIESCNECGRKHTNVAVFHVPHADVWFHTCPAENKTTEA